MILIFILKCITRRIILDVNEQINLYRERTVNVTRTDIWNKLIIWFPYHNLVVRASGGAVNLQTFALELLKPVKANLACKRPQQAWPRIGNSVRKQVLNHYYPLIDHAARQASYRGCFAEVFKGIYLKLTTLYYWRISLHFIEIFSEEKDRERERENVYFVLFYINNHILIKWHWTRVYVGCKHNFIYNFVSCHI